MHRARRSGLVLAFVFNITLGAPIALSGASVSVAATPWSLFMANAAAQDPITITGDACGIVSLGLCTTAESDTGHGGNATSTGGDGGNGDRGGDGGVASVHGVGNAQENTSCSVIIGDITTGNEGDHTVTVDADSITDPVLRVVGSITDTGVDVIAPDCSAEAATTDGSGIDADALGDAGVDGSDGRNGSDGGNGRDATATGDSGEASHDCAADAQGCFTLNLGG